MDALDKASKIGRLFIFYSTRRIIVNDKPLCTRPSKIRVKDEIRTLIVVFKVEITHRYVFLDGINFFFSVRMYFGMSINVLCIFTAFLSFILSLIII